MGAPGKLPSALFVPAVPAVTAGTSLAVSAGVGLAVSAGAGQHQFGARLLCQCAPKCAPLQVSSRVHIIRKAAALEKVGLL